jgi:hypothetical protein
MLTPSTGAESLTRSISSLPPPALTSRPPSEQGAACPSSILTGSGSSGLDQETVLKCLAATLFVAMRSRPHYDTWALVAMGAKQAATEIGVRPEEFETFKRRYYAALAAAR